MRIAVIENEFGGVGVDAEFLVQDRAETIIQLANGCREGVRAGLDKSNAALKAVDEMIARAKARTEIVQKIRQALEHQKAIGADMEAEVARIGELTEKLGSIRSWPPLPSPVFAFHFRLPASRGPQLFSPLTPTIRCAPGSRKAGLAPAFSSAPGP